MFWSTCHRTTATVLGACYNSVCRAERERARVEQQSTSSKLFTVEGTDDSGNPLYSPTPYVQKVCQVVDGFIYVANAESDRGERKRTFKNSSHLSFLIIPSYSKPNKSA